ncbi:RNA-binding protein [candidate division WOR-3 bacterium]|nr:RNA-binding protein [candidate division WOR-3 bacterium]
MQDSRLYVGNLAYSVTKEELQSLFQEFGEVKEINIIEGKGFGFVEMSDSNSASKAKDSLDGKEFKSRNIKVSEARPKRNDKPRNNYRKGYGRN